MVKHVNYDEVSTVYDQRYKLGGPAGIAEYLRDLVYKVKAHRVLEVGCGTGYWLTLMNNYEFRYGLDYSAGMLNKARQRGRDLGLVCGSATQLPFCKKVFDFVFCVNALHHFDDPLAFIDEACRVIGRGGVLAVIGMDPQSEQDWWYVYNFFPGTYETDLDRYPSGDMILRWMRKSGFVNCERRLVARIEHDFSGKEVLDDPILQKNGTSQLSLLTENAFADGMARIMKALQQAERHGEKITFRTNIALPAVVGFMPDAS